jgi:hypothetical protein
MILWLASLVFLVSCDFNDCAVAPQQEISLVGGWDLHPPILCASECRPFEEAFDCCLETFGTYRTDWMPGTSYEGMVLDEEVEIITPTAAACIAQAHGIRTGDHEQVRRDGYVDCWVSGTWLSPSELTWEVGCLDEGWKRWDPHTQGHLVLLDAESGELRMLGQKNSDVTMLGGWL